MSRMNSAEQEIAPPKKRVLLIDWNGHYLKTLIAMDNVEIAMAVVDRTKVAKRCQEVADGKITSFYFMRFESEADFLQRNKSNYDLTYDEIREYADTQLKVEHYLHRELHCDADVQHRYFVALRFWLEYFSKEKIDLIISADAEHGAVWDTIIYDIAKQHNIPVYVPGLMCPCGTGFITSLRDRNSRRLLDLSQVGGDHTDSNNMFKQLDGYSRQFKKLARKRNRNILRWLWKCTQASLIELAKIWGPMLNRDGEKYLYVAKSSKKERSCGYAWAGHLQAYYMRVSERADYDKPYIYYPLHQEPEATIMVQADFTSQLAIIGWISQCLPKGWQLYVKEHPSSFSCYEKQKQYYKNLEWFKSPRLYSAIKRYPNVKLISMKEPSDELTKQSRAVASICGTALTEAIALHKPILVFGRGISWYEHLQDALCIDSVHSLRLATHKLETLSAPEYADINEVVNRFAYYDEVKLGSDQLAEYSPVKERLLRYLLQERVS